VIPLCDNIPTKTFPWVRWLILAANIYVFWIELHLPAKGLEPFVTHWGVVPRMLFGTPGAHAYTLITAMFVHGGWMHIIGNMLFFYIFADNVEDTFGHFKFLLFYILVGIIANGTQAYLMPTSVTPLIGASGAIAGVLGAYFFYFPHSKITTLIPLGFFITIREVPSFFFLGIWFLLQMINGTHSGHPLTGGIAWWAHASGFVAGILLAPLFGGKKSNYR